jgi:hypothetical protein
MSEPGETGITVKAIPNINQVEYTRTGSGDPLRGGYGDDLHTVNFDFKDWHFFRDVGRGNRVKYVPVAVSTHRTRPHVWVLFRREDKLNDPWPE